MEVLPGIHRIETDLHGRTLAIYWIQGKKDAILIDTGLTSHPETILIPYLKAHSLSLNSLKEVYISHSDFDHFGGNFSLQRLAPQAIFYAHPHDISEITDPRKMISRYRQFEQYDQIVDSSEGYDWILSVTQSHSQVLPIPNHPSFLIDNQQWQILETPGHSKGHLSFYHPESNTAIIQDAILGSGLIDSNLHPVFAPTYRFVSDYRKTIEKIRSLSLNTLLTSHYPVFRGEGVEAFIQESIDFCNRMEKEILIHLKEKKSDSLQSMVIAIAPKMGRWNPTAWNTFAWPLAGHLEELRDQKIVQSHLNEQTTIWSYNLS